MNEEKIKCFPSRQISWTQFFPHVVDFVNSHCYILVSDARITGQRCCISIERLTGNRPLKVNLWYKPNRKESMLKSHLQKLLQM